ncbi:MAG TPA: DEAD/DEAH box helicase [Acidimicrobiales bacterium]|nr:DEAD/DEAH box helicase [Acidimicrobiales bacterium]
MLDEGLPGTRLRWSPEAKRFAENRRWAAHRAEQWRRDVRAISEGGRAAAEAALGDAKGLEVLDDHQWVNVAAMTLPDGPGLCVFDEQGAGKTVTAIFAFDVLVDRNQADLLLIVAPKSMVAEWPADFARFKGDLYHVETLTGSRASRRRLLAEEPDVLVANFEAVVAMEAELRAILRRHGDRAVLVVDESYHVKNRDARRTQVLRRLREWCGRTFVLCGTPAPNSAHDLVEQFNLVDFGVTFEGVEVPADREEARAVVRQVLSERGAYTRHLKAEVLPELPTKSFHRILVPLGKQQRRLYQGALHDLIIDLRSIDDSQFRQEITSFLARRSALLQICSNPAKMAPEFRETPAKLVVLDQLLADAIGRRGEKVVVWSFYTASLASIFDRYQRWNPVRYDGSITDIAERREAVSRFQSDSSTMLFVGNPAAAGAGLTLHRARLAVYESLSNQAAHYLQSLDRIHRRGQERAVEYTVLLCDGTIELTEFERLAEKERSAQLLLGDRVDAVPTRETMLAELESAALLAKLTP